MVEAKRPQGQARPAGALRAPCVVCDSWAGRRPLHANRERAPDPDHQRDRGGL